MEGISLVTYDALDDEVEIILMYMATDALIVAVVLCVYQCTAFL